MTFLVDTGAQHSVLTKTKGPMSTRAAWLQGTTGGKLCRRTTERKLHLASDFGRSAWNQGGPHRSALGRCGGDLVHRWKQLFARRTTKSRGCSGRWNRGRLGQRAASGNLCPMSRAHSSHASSQESRSVYRHLLRMGRSLPHEKRNCSSRGQETPRRNFSPIRVA